VEGSKTEMMRGLAPSTCSILERSPRDDIGVIDDAGKKYRSLAGRIYRVPLHTVVEIIVDWAECRNRSRTARASIISSLLHDNRFAT
jgi:hypothetical protein